MLTPPGLGVLRSALKLQVSPGSTPGLALLRARPGKQSARLVAATVATLGASALALQHRRSMSGQRQNLPAAQLQAAPMGSPAVSWEELQEKVEATASGQRFKKLDEARLAGLAPHTDAKVRYFGKSRETPRIKLYRDQAAWCPYCQKVWLLLEAKEVDYAIEKVPMRSYGDKPQSFMQKVPRGLLPAVEIDGKLMTESLDIMFMIESTFKDPERPMFPPEGPERNRAVKLLELERKIFGAWCSYLFSPEMPFFGGQDFRSAMASMEAELKKNSDSPWFLPYEHPTIVDMQYVSHVERMVASAHYFKGLDIRDEFPRINKWLAAFEEIPYYMATKSDYYTHIMDIPPQYGQPYPSSASQAVEVRKVLDPTTPRWPIDLEKSVEPMTKAQLAAPKSDHCIEAAWRLINNHAAVSRFCCRAAGNDVGDWGRNNPSRSSLADPFAKPNLNYAPVVDTVLLSVCSALVAENPELARVGSAAAVQGLSSSDVVVITNCLQYLQKRVGVPRDMQAPAAKILRATLTEAIAGMA